MVIGLLFTLAVLVVLSVSLWGLIQRMTSSRLYNQALESQNDGDDRNALRRFDEFLTRFPGDGRAGKARVLRALSNVRQFTASAGASWTHALEAEKAMFAALGREPAFRDASTELSDQIMKTAEALADRARTSADAEALGQAEAARGLFVRVAGKSAEARLARSRLPHKLAEGRAAVRKAATRRQALADMDAALKAGSSSGVYAARDALVRDYGDLAADPALVERLTSANELIRREVKLDPSQRPAETEPRSDRMGPPLTLVMTDPPNSPVANPNRPENGSPLVFGLADGLAYGLDGASGAPLWQVPVGVSAPFPPQPIPGGSTVLCFDARSNELVRLQGRTGALLWRQEIGEPIERRRWSWATRSCWRHPGASSSRLT